MIQEQYKNFLISQDYAENGKSYFLVWKLDENGSPFDLWGENFQSIRQAKTFINMECEHA